MRTRRAGAGAPRWLAIGASAVAALLVAEGAAWLLRPRDVIDPIAIDEAAYFPRDLVERASGYRDGQRLLMVGGLLAQGVVLAVLVSGRPAAARRLLERAGERPVLGGATAAGGLMVVVSLASLPFDVAAHERAVDVGLSTQNLGAWALDRTKGTAITAVLAAGIGTAALALIRRYRERWWIPGSVGLVGAAVVFTWLAPVVLAPAFNDFERLEQGEARSDVLELGQHAGVEIGEVYRVDASRRSTALNAYVDGLGPSKRVVLYDNLIEGLDRGERRSVVAHELAHVEQRDIQRGLLFVAITAPLALLFVGMLSDRLSRIGGAEPGRPASLPALALAISAASFAIGVAGNQLSRDVEAKADTEALELTGDPAAMIALQQRLQETNLSDPSPPALAELLFSTHPSAVDRVGMARAFEEGR